MPGYRAVRLCVPAVILAAAWLAAGPAPASTFVTLADRNSTATFDLLPQPALASWQVDGVEHLHEQWFWYRTAGMTREARIDELGFIDCFVANTNFDPAEDTLTLLYGNPLGLNVELKFYLSGGLAGSGRSDLGETITLNNNSAQAIRLQLFQYCDFDLAGTPGNDTVQVVNANTVRQWDAGAFVSETVATPAPARTEVGLYSATLDKLDDAKADDLVTGPAGPGNATWAFQWDLTVPAGGSVQISKDKQILPEPATLALMAAGAVMSLGLRRRR